MGYPIKKAVAQFSPQAFARAALGHGMLRQPAERIIVQLKFNFACGKRCQPSRAVIVIKLDLAKAIAGLQQAAGQTVFVLGPKTLIVARAAYRFAD